MSEKSIGKEMDWKDVATEILVLVVVSILSAIGAYVFRPMFDDWLAKRKKKRGKKSEASAAKKKKKKACGKKKRKRKR